MIDIIKKPISVILKLLLGLILAVTLYIATALGYLGINWLTTGSKSDPAATIPIYLFADDFHADLMIPVDPMSPQWDYLLKPKGFPIARQQIKMLSFGWGSSEFYLKMREWNKISLGLSIKALALDDTVMHITAYRNDSVKLDHPMVTRLFITKEGYQRLQQFIRQSHKLTDNQAIPILNKGYWNNDTFFMANGNYHPLRTCNQWTGEALRHAGIKTPLWAPFSHSLKWSLN